MFIETDNLPNNNTHLAIDIRYSKGGLNFYSYKTEPRGYYFHIQPCIVKNEKFGQIVEYNSIHDFDVSFKTIIYKVNRYNKKTHKLLLDLLEANKEKIVDIYKNRKNIDFLSNLHKIFYEYIND